MQLKPVLLLPGPLPRLCGMTSAIATEHQAGPTTAAGGEQ